MSDAAGLMWAAAVVQGAPWSLFQGGSLAFRFSSVKDSGHGVLMWFHVVFIRLCASVTQIAHQSLYRSRARDLERALIVWMSILLRGFRFPRVPRFVWCFLYDVTFSVFSLWSVLCRDRECACHE